jgi:hypothetical protein
MKTIFYLIVLFFMVIGILCCKKENNIIRSTNDSIPLFYQELDPNSTSINLTDGTTIYFYSNTITYYNGPHPYERTNTVIKTSDTNMLVSCGINYYHADIDIDTLINNYLYWSYSVYISYNFTLTDYISVNPKYIGLRKIHGDTINYGWVQCNNNKFVAYAIDTSSTANGVIKAGRRFKYF